MTLGKRMSAISSEGNNVPHYIYLLNKIRNQVAHTLEINRDTIDELIKLNSEEPDCINGIDDAERTKAIKQITKFTCFHILGVIVGMHAVLYMDDVEPGT